MLVYGWMGGQVKSSDAKIYWDNGRSTIVQIQKQQYSIQVVVDGMGWDVYEDNEFNDNDGIYVQYSVHRYGYE